MQHIMYPVVHHGEKEEHIQGCKLEELKMEVFYEIPHGKVSEVQHGIGFVFLNYINMFHKGVYYALPVNPLVFLYQGAGCINRTDADISHPYLCHRAVYLFAHMI